MVNTFFFFFFPLRYYLRSVRRWFNELLSGINLNRELHPFNYTSRSFQFSWKSWRWDFCVVAAAPKLGSETFKAIKPGLSAYADDPEKVGTNAHKHTRARLKAEMVKGRGVNRIQGSSECGMALVKNLPHTHTLVFWACVNRLTYLGKLNAKQVSSLLADIVCIYRI